MSMGLIGIIIVIAVLGFQLAAVCKRNAELEWSSQLKDAQYNTLKAKYERVLTMIAESK